MNPSEPRLGESDRHLRLKWSWSSATFWGSTIVTPLVSQPIRPNSARKDLGQRLSSSRPIEEISHLVGHSRLEPQSRGLKVVHKWAAESYVQRCLCECHDQ